MKINLPAIEMVRVGLRIGTDHFYDDDNRPNRYGKETVLREPRLTSFTALDYDFQALARLVGVKKLLVFTGFLIAAVPLALAHMAGEKVGGWIETAIETMADFADEHLGDAARSGLKGTYARILKEITR